MAFGFLNTLGSAIGGAVKKVGNGIIPGNGGGMPPLPVSPKTPPFNPAISTPAIAGAAPMRAAAAKLPALPTGTPAPAPVAPMNPPPTMGRGILPGDASMDRRGVPIPALPGRGNDPTPYDPVSARRYDYVMEGAKRNEAGDLSGGFKRSGKDILMSALAGAGQGMATTGSPWGALGGAMAGSAGTAIAPQRGREMLFDTFEMPQIEAQQQREDALFKRESERVRMEQDALMGRARLEGIAAQRDADRARAEDLGREKFRDAPWGTYSERTGEVKYQRPPGSTTQTTPFRGIAGVGVLNTQTGEVAPFPGGRPMNREDAMDEVLAEDGSVESIAASSLEGRRDSLMQQLTPVERAYLTSGPSPDQLKAKLSPEQRAVIDGAPSGNANFDAQAYSAWERVQRDAEGEAVKARNKWNQIQKAEYDRILRETQGVAKQKAAARRASGGGKAAMPRTGGAGGTAPRNVNDLLKYLQ